MRAPAAAAVPDVAAGATADVAAELGALADVAGGEAAAGAVEFVPGPVLVAAGAGGACAAAPVAEAAWDVAAAAEVTCDVAEARAEVVCDVAEARAEGVDAAADVAADADEAAGVAVNGGGVAASACRENTSKTTKIPAATIATCTARRAM